MAVIVLIPAAGTGSRMGAAINKQYLTLHDRPVLAHTLTLFQHHPLIDDIYVISPHDEIEYCRSEVVARFGFTKVRAVLEGGAERQDSVRNGLDACAGEPGDIALIHDGVRPFFPPDLIDPLLASAKRHGGCVVGVPVKDTIKEVVDGRIIGTPLRERFWQAQTPQAFPLERIRSVHRRAFREGVRATDDAMLAEHYGHPVVMMLGSYRNIKITTPEDLVLARAFLSEGGTL